jgi:glycosyltransferase involved in cell wall biosynthesis
VIDHDRRIPESRDTRRPSLAITHDWMVEYAGSERCVRELLTVFPSARVLTTVVNREALPPDLRRKTESSWLQGLPLATTHHEWFLPLMLLTWSLRRPLDGVDAVVSSSHACAKGVRLAPGIPHICYCHTPMRYAWNYEAERQRFSSAARPLVRLSTAALRRWDASTSRNVDRFVANSSAVAARIREAYHRVAEVVFPPVDTDFYRPGGEREEFFLFVGRLVSYKRPDIAVQAFRTIRAPLYIVGHGQLESRLRRIAPANVSFLGSVSNSQLRDLYQRARALIHPGEEDFGIAMAEAQAAGTPVIASSLGGARDIVRDGQTGWLMSEPTVEALEDAITRAQRELPDVSVIRSNSLRFARDVFRARMAEIVAETIERGAAWARARETA